MVTSFLTPVKLILGYKYNILRKEKRRSPESYCKIPNCSAFTLKFTGAF